MFSVGLDQVGAVGQALDDAQFLQVLLSNFFGLETYDLDCECLLGVVDGDGLVDLGIASLPEGMGHEEVLVLHPCEFVVEGDYLRSFLHSMIQV